MATIKKLALPIPSKILAIFSWAKFNNLFKIQNHPLCSKNDKPNTYAHKYSLECKTYFFLLT